MDGGGGGQTSRSDEDRSGVDMLVGLLLGVVVRFRWKASVCKGGWDGVPCLRLGFCNCWSMVLVLDMWVILYF